MAGRRKNHVGLSLFAFQDIITCVMGIMLLLTLIMCLQISTTIVADSPIQQSAEQLKRESESLAAEVSLLSKEVERQQALLQSGAINDPSLLRDRSVALQDELQRAEDDFRKTLRQRDSSDRQLEDLEKTAKLRQGDGDEIEDLQQMNERLREQLSALRNGDRLIYNSHDSPSKTCWLIEMHSETSFLAAELGVAGRPQTFTSVVDLQNWCQSRSGLKSSFLLLVKPNSADVFETIAEDLRKRNISFGFDLIAQDGIAIDPVFGAGAHEKNEN